MLSVHRTPIQPRSPSVVERGRSRDIPPAAIARRASEERRQSVRRAAALAVRLVSDAPCTSYATSVSPSTLAFASRPSSTARGSHPPSTQAVASSTSCRLPSPLSSLTPTKPITNYSYTPSSLSRVIDSPAQLSYDPQPQPAVSCKPYTVTQAFVYQSSVVYDDTPLPPRSLQDQMQEAYAADNMHLARVLYLKIQGIEVTNDDDPRIAQVRDEDFVFVPGGELVLDDEALAVLNEERARREKEMQARKQAWEAEAERVRVAKARRQGETRSAESTQRLEFKAKGRLQWLRGRPLRTNLASHPFPHNLSSQSSQSLSSSRYGLAANFRATVTGTPPARVPFKEVVQRLQGSLFADAEPSETRRSSSGSQDRLLDTLLQAVEWQDGERGRAKGKGKELEGPLTWTNGQLRQSPVADATCLACSVGTDSTISRTNSWASTTSDASVTTCISSPATSPHFGSKLQLPPLMNDKAFRKLAVHSCRPLRRSNLTAVPLMESPLLCKDAHKLEQGVEATRRSSHERNNEHDKFALITRVRQSVAGLVDFASKIQQSYLRTIQFTVTMPRDAVPPPSENSACPVPLRLKPAGYRASACDVQRFAPRLASAPTRELNFPSETNIPLESPYPPAHGGPPGPARVFAPLAFVPPSSLRPRHTPAVPEWRLRPVANPCTLRLRALANRLAGCGIPWEGRSHTGSLGCGRERLTGVAFEGLGGSRLAFEAKHRRYIFFFFFFFFFFAIVVQMPPKSKSIFRQPGARHFQLVHRSQRDPLIHDPDASQHVLKPIVKGKTRADLERTLAPTEFAHDAARANIGEAAAHGVYFDDTDYDYMQHLRPVGMREDGVDGVLIEAPAASSAQSKQKGRGKTRAGADAGALRLRDLDLPREALPSTEELTHEQVYGAQAAVPAALAGLQPDMDPHLRQALEALDDDAFVDDGLDDDFFVGLVSEGERGGSDEEGCAYEFREEGIEEGKEGSGGENERDETGGRDGDEDDCWEARFARFKKEHEAKAKDRPEESDAASDARSERVDTVGQLLTFSAIGGKRRRRGTTDASGYSMSSSSMFRNEGLTVLDERFDQVEKEYASDEVDELSEDEDEAPELITSREDFNAIMDDFLDNYEILGGKMRHVLAGETVTDKLGTIRQSLREIGYDAHQQLEEDEEIDDAFENLVQEKGDRWDCETILSTYSNLENHPRLIRAREVKIRLDPKTGLPSVKPAKDEKQSTGAPTDDGAKATQLRVTVSRPKDESKEERQTRKQAVKEERQARRVEKKMTKVQYSNEKKHQLHVLTNAPKKGVRKL